MKWFHRKSESDDRVQVDLAGPHLWVSPDIWVSERKSEERFVDSQNQSRSTPRGRQRRLLGN